MASTEQETTPAVGVKALTQFFQNLETEKAVHLSPQSPAKRVAGPPSAGKATECTTPDHEAACGTLEDVNVMCASSLMGKGLQTSCRPVPQPRISILRKQSQCSRFPALRCHSLSSYESFVSSKDTSIPEEGEERDYGSNCEDEDDIYEAVYEELPAEYHCNMQLSRDGGSRKNSRSHPLGTLILKSKLLKSRILVRGEEKGRKTFFPFTRSRENRDLPKPPSINVVNASIEQLNKQVLHSDQRQELYHDETCDPYYDVQELGSDAGASQSDDYYERISPLSDSDCVYEEVYGSRHSEQIYESLPFSNYANCDRVEYVEIDARKTAELEKKIEKEQKLLEKRLRESAEKLRIKFNMTGQEIPVNCGVVKEDAKKSKYNLRVKKGEVVLVLRMEENPPGLWLAKNERSEIGYVQLANISFDAAVVKTLMHVKPLTD